MHTALKIFFDGGCRGADGDIEIAVVARGRTTVRRDLGRGTSADAEWLALIEAARIAAVLEVPDAVLLGDSADVVAKAAGRRPCDAAARAHAARFAALCTDRRLRVRWVRRSQNLAGIALARLHPR